MKYKVMISAWVLLALMVSEHRLQAQNCSLYGGELQISLLPSTPLTFQFFPIGLLGLGGSTNAGTVSTAGFERFGVQFTNSGTVQRQVNLAIFLFQGAGTGQTVFGTGDEMRVTLFVPPGTYFVSVPQFINGNITSVRAQAFVGPRISERYRNSLSGGIPSGSFHFDFAVTDENGGNPTLADLCGSLSIEVLTGATVDLIVPGNGSQVGPLPLFQWAAVGGNKFQLNFAKVRAEQSYEDALRTSSQRVLLEINGTNTFQATAGGPISGGNVTTLENNLTWNPGLLEGEYCYRVTMIQEDPITGSQNLVTSAINSFTVSNTAMMIGVGGGINTDEILNLLRSLSTGEAIVNELRGYSAISIEINGTAATVTDLRTKLGDLPDVYKVEIKP